MSKKEAEEEKEKGNSCMKEKKYVEAMFHYTNAIKRQPNECTLYSNRSFAFKCMDQYYYAMEDAKKAITLNPKWAKGYFRLGEVQFATEHYQDALWSYEQALNCSREDEKLRQCVTKAKQQLSATKKYERRMPIYGVIGGIFFSLLIVISDHVMPKPVLNHMVLQILLMVALSGLGYGGALAYRYFLRNQRNSLLEEPIDLYGSDNDSSNNTASENNAENADKKPRKRRSAAAARQQAKHSTK